MGRSCWRRAGRSAPCGRHPPWPPVGRAGLAKVGCVHGEGVLAAPCRLQCGCGACGRSFSAGRHRQRRDQRAVRHAVLSRGAGGAQRPRHRTRPEYRSLSLWESFADTPLTVLAGRGCELDLNRAVLCDLPQGLRHRATITLGDRGDSVDMSGAGDLWASVKGGEGPDFLSGTSSQGAYYWVHYGLGGSEPRLAPAAVRRPLTSSGLTRLRLSGGPGGDTLNGGAGDDLSGRARAGTTCKVLEATTGFWRETVRTTSLNAMPVKTGSHWTELTSSGGNMARSACARSGLRYRERLQRGSPRRPLGGPRSTRHRHLGLSGRWTTAVPEGRCRSTAAAPAFT